MVFFASSEDARWNDERGAVEFTAVLGEYQGRVRVHRRSCNDCSTNHRRWGVVFEQRAKK